ncbi:hypothetical protein FRC00_000259, partial [Tulasnella sp. 408]
MLKDISGSHQGTEEQYIDYITSPLRNRGGPSPRGSAGSSRSGENAATTTTTTTTSSSKPDPRLFSHPVPPLLSYEAPLPQQPSLMQLAGSNLSQPAPPLFTPGALEEAKPMFRDASGSTTTSLASIMTDSGYGSAVDQNQAQGWAAGGSSTAGGAFHLGVPGVAGAVEMNRGMARSANGDFGHPHASATAAAWAMHSLAPHGYLPTSAGMAPSTSAPPFHLSSSAAALHASSFNPFHVAADPNTSLFAQSTAAAAAQAQDQQEVGRDGLPQIKLEAAPSPALDTIGLPDPESPSPLPSRPLSASVVGAGVRRLGAPTSIDLTGSNFNDYRGTSALLSAVSATGSVAGFDSHHLTTAGSVPSSATEAFFTVPPVSAPAGATFHLDHLHSGLHHHRYIPSAPTSATAETFGSLDLSRRPSMDDEFLNGVSSGLDVLSYAAMGPSFASVIDASATTAIQHHQASEEGPLTETVSQATTRSPSPFSDPA